MYHKIEEPECSACGSKHSEAVILMPPNRRKEEG